MIEIDDGNSEELFKIEEDEVELFDEDELVKMEKEYEEGFE